MNAQKNQIILKVVLLLALIILAVVVLLPLLQPAKDEDQQPYLPQHGHDIQQGTPANSPLQLKDITRAARTWRPGYPYWYGEAAPDFTLVDITGKGHKLSDYHGKSVIVNFWASWCIPCLMEIPHLVTLRNETAKEKLAILAISDEPLPEVKKAVEHYRMNYTIFSADSRKMPRPYKIFNSLPTNVFITSEGKIKLIAEGGISLAEIQAILQAKQ